MIPQKASQLPARQRLFSKRGQTLVEYALVIAFISVVAIATLLSMGSQVGLTYSTVTMQLTVAKDGGVSGRH